MKFAPIRKMQVLLNLLGVRRELGTLAWSADERQAYFEYAPGFVVAPLPVSPFRLPVRAGLTAARSVPREFEGLHGLFNDSVPDGWGRLLLDRRLANIGAKPGDVSPIDRLSAVGGNGMGALVFVPELPNDRGGQDDLDWFVEQVDRVQGEMEIADIDALQAAQGGSAGARPKIMIGLDGGKQSFRLDYGLGLPEGFESWLVKGRAIGDRDDIAVEEHAYALMARDAGIEMAQTSVIKTARGNRLFATRRFDRTASGRLHMHTAGGLLNASHQEASLDYGALHKLTAVLTRNSRDVARMFRHMTFNVLAHNRDDHAKNHAFLMDGGGKWTLAPAYDLTFSDGPAGEHSAAIAGEGRHPGRDHLIAVAKDASIPEREALGIIDEVRAAIARWPRWADEAGLGKARTAELDGKLNGARG
ncbi:type II toxin-antitoxin system HipA family toxin [Pleomorphomonas diazotrophica]|uniref:Type II toxin-antitoxin system HipA family toxin n=1 Tax=Pleomorphomonas diazotrophica TaxID=1166257 RepID=A0A1I4W491_9HYPH|nr:type II toxin-antitoxin system HipA family toxin [Pleomorphomonas diazotrophica]PKR87862.1 type II toxin-antitoxin system HipA family toxin [Pleomorphomonas diazotrophica]SFN08398.1 serine/threonine-protein kinase HipA [Pleomorphomonas diazotrophica]